MAYDLTLEFYLPVSPDKVMRLLTEAELIKEWSSNEAVMEYKVGGRVELFDSWASGKVLKTGDNELAYTWSVIEWDKDAVSEVYYVLSEENGATKVDLKHINFPTEEEMNKHASGWTEHFFGPMENYILEKIFDLRQLAVISILVVLVSCGDAVKVDYSVGKAIEHTAEEVKKAAYEYNAAVIAKDTNKLNSLLHDKLSYGHSNGWTETKSEQKANLYNGTITYHEINQPEIAVILNGDMATVRGNGIFDVDYKEYEHLSFDLNVMQTWVWEDDRWQMLNRQSVGNDK